MTERKSIFFMRRALIAFSVASAFLLIGSVFGGSVVGVASAKQVAKINPNGTFIFGSIQGTLTNLNPLTATSMAGDIDALLYSSLLYPGTGGGVIPWLAKSYNVSNNGLTFTFNLVHNATWSNGHPVTATDVKYTFQSLINTPSIDFFSYNKYIQSVVAVNNYTVVFNLKMFYSPLIYEIGTEPIIPAAWGNSPYSSNLSSFTNYATNITSGSYQATNLITDGPLILNSMSTTAGTVFSANKHFFNGPPSYAKMVWEYFKTTSDATAALESKTIDAFWGPYTDRALFAKIPYIRSVSAPSTYEFFVWMNNAIAPFNNTYARKAVAYVINKTNLNLLALAGAGLTGSYGALPALYRNQIPSGLPFYHSNLTQAAIMMRDGGFTQKGGQWYYPNGTQVTATLIEPPLADWVTAGNVIANNLTAFGIKTTYVANTFPQWSSNTGYGRYQLTYFGYTGYAPNPWSVLNSLFSNKSSAPVGQFSWTHGWNVERYNNTTVNNLLSQAASTSNSTRVQQLLDNVQQIIAAQVPVAMASDPPTFFSYNNQTIRDNTPNYNIAWAISVEHVDVLQYVNETAPNYLQYIGGGIVVVILGGIAGAIFYVRKKRLKERHNK